MGSCQSLSFEPDVHVPGQTPECFRIMKSLGLNKSDVDKFYNVFRKIDMDNSHTIKAGML